MTGQEAARRIPQLHRLLEDEAVARLLGGIPRELARDALREEIAELRRRAMSGVEIGDGGLQPDAIVRGALRRLSWYVEVGPAEVINATGVVLHTNLGRAPLAMSAARAAERAGASYCDLEYDRASGQRGSRQTHLEELLRRITGAQAAVVVNNNAAAVLLGLAALCAGGEVVISRGELVEIGGSFRVPDVMAASGAALREVGTTNRTRARDYLAAIGPETRAILRVHPSNFRIIGFTERADGAELAEIAHSQGLLFIEDLGSGALVPTASEPTVQDVLRTGVDLVTLSGDKLVGGPQAGIALGRPEVIERLRKHPLYRALRPDKMTIAALAETLRLYLAGDLGEIPTQAMLRADPDTLRRRAQRLVRSLKLAGAVAQVVQLKGRAGGGSLPEEDLPSFGVQLEGPADRLHAVLRKARPAVVGRIEDDRLLLDLRTVLPAQEEDLKRAVREALRGIGNA